MKKPLRVHEVATLMGCCTATVYEHIKAGRLKAHQPGGKIYFVSEDDFYAFLVGDEQFRPDVPVSHPYEPGGGLDEF